MEKAKTLGNEAFKEGRCEEAIEAYTEALGYDSLNTIYNSTVYCNRAAAKMKIKQVRVSRTPAEISIRSRRSLARGGWACSLSKVDPVEALRAHSGAIHLVSPADSGAKSPSFFDMERLNMEQFKEALQDCDESIKLNEGYIKAYTRKAECLLQTQEYEGAIHVIATPHSPSSPPSSTAL